MSANEYAPESARTQLAAPQGEASPARSSEPFPEWLAAQIDDLVARLEIARPPLPAMYLEAWGRSASEKR